MTRLAASLGAVSAGFRAEAIQLRRAPFLVALTLVHAVTFLLLVSVFGLTGSRVPTAVVDNDGGSLAQLWIADMSHSNNTYGVRRMSAAQADQALRRGDVAAVMTIPNGFSAAIAGHRMVRVPIRVDNVNADLTDDIERGMPAVVITFAHQTGLANPSCQDDASYYLGCIRVGSLESALIGHETDFIPYLVVSALGLDAFVVAGILGATAVAREFEMRTVMGLRLAPLSPLLPLAGRIGATALVSAAAVGITALFVVTGYRVVPVHPLEAAGALVLCVAIFSCVGAAAGALLRRTLPVAALMFGLALPLYVGSGSLEPVRFDGEAIWWIAHVTPVYYAIGVLQDAFHGLHVTPEPVAFDAAALGVWAVVAGLVAWLAVRRGVRT